LFLREELVAKKFAILFLSFVLLLSSCSRTSQSPADFHFEEVKSFTESVRHFNDGNLTSIISNILINPTNPKGIYVVAGLGTLKSDDRGIHFYEIKITDMFRMNPHTVEELQVGPADTGKVFVIINHTLFMSYNSGKNSQMWQIDHMKINHII